MIHFNKWIAAVWKTLPSGKKKKSLKEELPSWDAYGVMFFIIRCQSRGEQTLFVVWTSWEWEWGSFVRLLFCLRGCKGYIPDCPQLLPVYLDFLCQALHRRQNTVCCFKPSCKITCNYLHQRGFNHVQFLVSWLEFVCEITQKPLNGFPGNLDGGLVSAQNRPH